MINVTIEHPLVPEGVVIRIVDDNRAVEEIMQDVDASIAHMNGRVELPLVEQVAKRVIVEMERIQRLAEMTPEQKLNVANAGKDA